MWFFIVYLFPIIVPKMWLKFIITNEKHWNDCCCCCCCRPAVIFVLSNVITVLCLSHIYPNPQYTLGIFFSFFQFSVMAMMIFNNINLIKLKRKKICENKKHFQLIVNRNSFNQFIYFGWFCLRINQITRIVLLDRHFYLFLLSIWIFKMENYVEMLKSLFCNAKKDEKMASETSTHSHA